MTPTTDWVQVCRLDDILRLGARIIPSERGDIAVFRCADDSVFALRNRCPHKHGPLSEGIVHGHRVACPLHSWVIDLETGEAAAPDIGCTPRMQVRVEAGLVWLSMPALAAARASA